MPPITVRDVIRLALPPGTTIVAGASGAAHQVTWVVTQRATPPVFINLRGGELALVSVTSAQALDERLTLASLVERLAHVPVAALAIIGSVPDDARVAADTTRIPLLRLPDGTSLPEIEREVQRLISDYDAQLERRAAQFASQLTQRSLAGSGLVGLLDLLSERTGQAVGCYTVTGETRVLRGRGGPARVALQTLRPTTPGALTQLGQAVWVQPFFAGGGRLGFIAIAGAVLDDWDRLATQHGAAAIALELAKEQAVQAAEDRLRGDFVQAVLMGQAGDTDVLLRRGQELGYDLRLPYAALLCSVAPDNDTTGRNGALDMLLTRSASLIAAGLAALNIPAPTMRRDDGVLCYLPVAANGPRARELAERLHARLAPDISPLVLALGKEAPNIAAWSRSLREAEQALILGRKLLDTRGILDFGDLGVYRLLVLLRESPELWDFYRTTLAALSEYDRKQGAELLKTLDAFFACLGNLARTAETLHVHRNTLLYRLKRINEISGLDLENDSEDRLALWLALKAHRVLRTLDDPNGDN